jgi:dienelactone hydrolase
VSGSLLERFAHFEFGSGDLSHRVFHAGDPTHPPILLMPEIAGLSPGLLMFAERLMDARFQVYMPWLFGAMGKRAPVRNAIRLCVSREFANLRAGVSAPVTTWLRALARHISERNGGTRVGAIGMCLTGAFAIPLVIDPAVVAAVAAQPAVPLSPLFASFGMGRGESLGQLNVSESDIAAARARLESGSARLFALRCRADRICPAEKLERLRKEFPVGLEVQEYGEPGDRNSLGDRPHATFTKEYRLVPDAPAEHHSRQALADLVSFFDRNLRERQSI